MDSSISTLTAAPRPFEFGGKTYQIYSITLGDFGKLESWAQARLPNPFKAVSEQLGTGVFTVAQEKALLDAAVRVAAAPRPRLGSPEIDAVIATTEGVAKMLQLAIVKGEPKFTEADAMALFNSLDSARAKELNELLDVESAVGGRGNSEGEGDDAPKSAAGGNSSTPP